MRARGEPPGRLVLMLSAGAWAAFLLLAAVLARLPRPSDGRLPDWEAWAAEREAMGIAMAVPMVLYMAASALVLRRYAARGRTASGDQAALHVGFLGAVALLWFMAGEWPSELMGGLGLVLAGVLLIFTLVAWVAMATTTSPLAADQDAPDLKRLAVALVVSGLALTVASVPLFALASFGLSYGRSSVPAAAGLVFLVPALYALGAAGWYRSLQRRAATDPQAVAAATRISSVVGIMLAVMLLGTLALVATCFAAVAVG